MDKPFTAWNSCALMSALPERFATLEEAQRAGDNTGSANRVTHDDGRQWAHWGSGDNDYMVTGWMQTTNTWDLPEHGDKCVTCGADRLHAKLIYTIVPRVVEGKHPGGRVVESSFSRYYCEQHLPTGQDGLAAHHQNHCGNYPETDPACPYCARSLAAIAS